MIKKIRNSKGNADNLFEIVEKANDNFEYLDKAVKDLPDYKKENFLKKEELIKPTIENIEGLRELFSKTSEDLVKANAEIENLKAELSSFYKLILENAGLIGKVNNQIIEIQNKIK